MAILDQAAQARRGERRFFGGMAIALAAIVLIGFARTYYLRPVFEPAPGDRPLTPLLHVHSVLFTAWLALFFAQVRLIAARRVDLHRRLGVAGAALAAAMIPVGVLVALHGAARGAAPGGRDPLRFLVVPLMSIVIFTALVALALWRRREARTHKRLMLLATVALLPPALARLILFHLGLGPPVVFGVASLFVVPLVVWDLATLRRLHPATLWGGLLVVGSGPLRLAIASTATWHALAERLVALVR